MWNFFIDNSRFTYLVILVFIGFGLFSVASIPKESSPEVQIPIGIVTTVLPGAPATDIESLITNELERGLIGTLENAKKITSTSKEGVSSIVVEFSAEADIDKSIRELKDRIDSLDNRLPSDAERPMVTEIDFVDQPILTLAVSGDKTDAEFSVIAQDLIAELESVAGVSRVEKSGVRDPEITVLVDQALLLHFNITVNDVLSAIRSANNTFPVGQIVTDAVYYNIIFESGINTADSIAEIPVAVRGGQPILVKDVAQVIMGLSPAATFSRLSVDNVPSENSLTISVYKQSGGDITRIADAVQEKIASLETSLLQDLSTYTVFDAGGDIKRDLKQLTTSGFQTVLLVVAILMIAIGWREGLIAGLAIPLSFTIGFIGLYLSDNTLNFISLFALILGIGVLVDSSIVVVEGINKKIKSDSSLSKVEAAKQVIAEFSAPIVSGTFTTVAMFVGLFVVSGVTGQFISAIPFTLIFIMIASLIVALGFLPLISARLLRQNAHQEKDDQVNVILQKTEDLYRDILTNTINSVSAQRKFFTFLFIGFVTSIALIPTGFVKVIFFEQSDSADVFIEVELSEGSVKESTDVVVRKVEDRLYAYPDMIKAFSVTVGAGSMFSNGQSGSGMANIHLSLTEDREISSTEFVEILRSDFSDIKDAKITFNQIANGPPTAAPIGVKVFGDDLQSVTETTNYIARLVAEIEGTTNIKTDANTNTTEVVFALDQQKAAVYGLNSQIVSQSLRSAVHGSRATSITTLKDDIDVVVRLNLTGDDLFDPEFSNWTTVDTLQNIELPTMTGDRVALSALGEVTLREASSFINHEDGSRVMMVSADITPTGNVIDINSQLKKQLEEKVDLPAGVTYSFGGESEESTQAFMELLFALVVGIVLMIAILVFQFGSYLHTFYVLSILPFSLIGILYGLAFTGSALSFPSIMGFIALSGIIVNNSILLIDMMNRMRKENPDKLISQVVIESSVRRLRPIVLTSAATAIGMIPLLFSDEIWIPLAAAVIFGLIFSVLITLVLVPVIYSKWPGKVNY